MEKLPMCRICLAQNVRMYVVVNKNLHELYERLTDIPFITDDNRPIFACSFCCAKLKQCYQLLRKCLNAEELFAQIMNGNYEPKPLFNQDHGLIISPIDSISIVDVGPTDIVVVKEELPVIFERQDDMLEPKEECQSDDLEPGNLDNSRLGVEDIPPHDFKSDSEDNVPLMKFKIEVEEEHEAFIENHSAVETNRPTVAEEPKLHSRRTQSEDSIPAPTDRNLTTHFREKPYKCDFCQRSFSHKNSLIKHFRIHTGEKPYKCNLCRSSFSEKSHLTRHVRTHTGEKPYKCDFCQRSFSQKTSLMNHYRSHTGEKPYKCDFCQRSYTRMFRLKNHICSTR